MKWNEFEIVILEFKFDLFNKSACEFVLDPMNTQKGSTNYILLNVKSVRLAKIKNQYNPDYDYIFQSGLFL